MNNKVLFIGIIGTREPEKELQLNYHQFCSLIDNKLTPLLQQEHILVIVSGKAPGIDTWAEQYARERSYYYMDFLGDLFFMLPYQGPENRFFKRNGLVAMTSDIFLSFPSFKFDKVAGGTKNTLNQAYKLGKGMNIHIYDPISKIFFNWARPINQFDLPPFHPKGL